MVLARNHRAGENKVNRTATRKKAPKGPQVLQWPALGDSVNIPSTGRDYIVQGPCEDAHAGHWYCITHDEHFGNQLQKDVHIHLGTHKMVWCCDLHGLEVSPNWV